MKHLVWGCGLLLLAGCHCCCQPKEAPAEPVITAQDTPVAEQIPVATSLPTPETTPVSSSEPVSTVPPTASAVKTKTATTKATVSTPKQEPAVAVADTAVFEDEPLIDMTDRLLNPLAAKQPTSDKHTKVPWKAEQLKYGIYYSFVKAGTAYIKNRGLIEVNGKPAFVIQTSAFSASVIDSIFKVRDINLSWLDAENFYSLGYSQSLREGKYKRDEWVRFDYPAHQYRGQVQKKGKPRTIKGSLSQPVLDVLTALYYVRTQPLKSGQEVVFDIVNREEQYPLVVKVIGKETIKTAAGKFKCVVVEPQFRGEGIFVSKGKNLKVWLTDDAYKMPVKMKTEVFIGSVSAELLEYKRN